MCITELNCVCVYGIADAGASLGGGLRLVTGLVRQLRTARRLLVTEMRRRDPAWTETAVQRARIKKAGHLPIASMSPWRRARLELEAEASVFATVIQDIEDATASCSP